MEIKRDSDNVSDKKGIPEVSIGLVGHIDHGKTTLTKALSGIWTDTHSEELKRGITIKLGYADTTFYYCKREKEWPKMYSTDKICPHCGKKTTALRTVSFVDAPGHETLMATMLSGAAIMDGAMLIIAANEPCPQPQTEEHLMALDIVGVKNIVIVQNKVDLVSKERALENYKEIKQFVKATIAEDVPIIPVSAQHNINIDALIGAIEMYIKTPKRDLNKPPKMYLARSFDVNKPSTEPEKLVGGVLGGVLSQGKLRVGDEIELRPGIMKKIENKVVWQPIRSKIASLTTGGVSVKEVTPGGSFGLATYLDPSLTKADNLSGNVAGSPGKLPRQWDTLKIEAHLLSRVVGSKISKNETVEPIKVNEPLMLNIASSTTVGIVTKIDKKYTYMKLKRPVCADIDSRLAISRRFGTRWRLVGYGIIRDI